MKNLTHKQLAEIRRQELAILRTGDKSVCNRMHYKEAGIVKQRMQVVREAEGKTINPPKNRYTVATAKSKREGYKLNKHKWVVESKPKEWIRLNNITVHKARVMGKQL